MKVVKNELLKVLSLVKPGLAKKEIVEQAAHFIFTGEDVVTFNDQISVMHPFKSEFPFSVKGDDFYKIVDKITESEFEITLEDDNLNIKAKKTKAALSTVVGEAAMILHLVDSLKQEMIGKNFWKALPKDFIDGVYLCAFSAAKDLTTGVRSCCAIERDAIYTTDNLRISSYIMEAPMDTLLLPAHAALDLIKYKVIEYGVSENWVHFRTADGITFNCKTMKGDYPFEAIKGVFVENEPILTFPSDLKENVLSIIPLADGDEDTNKCISVSIEKGRIVCKAEKERGWITKTVESDYEGATIKFLINPVFFCQILSHATAFCIVENRGSFESENFYHILALPEAG
jgi:DNA polymerase III sliding clamp (beta) subunit (PCNA family)